MARILKTVLIYLISDPDGQIVTLRAVTELRILYLADFFVCAIEILQKMTIISQSSFFMLMISHDELSLAISSMQDINCL